MGWLRHHGDLVTERGRPSVASNLLHKPLAKLYYRWIFGHAGALSRRIGASVSRWESRRGQGDAPASAATWDQQYNDGRWSLLAEDDELIRYAVLDGYARAINPEAAILDIGCGEGLLSRHLTSYARYLGVDISEVAISSARSLEDVRTRFVASDASCFSPEETFDVIVFNESLYYFAEPLAVLEHYGEFVEAGGVFLISMFRTPRSAAIARLLEKRHPIISESRIGNRRGEWLCIVLRPKGT